MGNGGSAYQNRLAKYAYARNRNQKVLPSVEAETLYGKLLLIASGADGKISEKERRWVVESRAALGKSHKLNFYTELIESNATVVTMSFISNKKQQCMEESRWPLTHVLQKTFP